MDGKVFKILNNKTYGRYLAANRPIKRGELILTDEPLAIGPQINTTKVICFKCCRIIQRGTGFSCDNCRSAILCNPKCLGAYHTDEECRQIARLNLPQHFFRENVATIVPLRIFLMKNYLVDEWLEINQLEHHVAVRKYTKIWECQRLLVEEVLRDFGVITQNDVEEEVIQKICGILDVNTFELRSPQCNTRDGLRGLYLKAALLAHNCFDNTHFAVDDDFKLYVHASVDIEENTPIFFNYSNVLKGNSERKKHLKEGKYFDCDCKRCSDPTEFQTHLSSLRCHKCRLGFIQPGARWKCNNCNAVFAEKLMETTLGVAENLIESTDSSNLKAVECVYQKLLQTFHPRHYLMLELQQQLIRLYEKSGGEIYFKKIPLCENLLEVHRILEPGISRTQGLLMYELQSAITNLAYEDYYSKKISLQTLSSRLASAESMLKDALLQHLIYEPKKSPEGKLTRAAFENLKTLRMSITNTKKSIDKKVINRNLLNK